jgi:hypothetical protein
MPDSKVTIDDIGFLINRLTIELEKLNEQVQNVNLSTDFNQPPKARKDTAADSKIRQFYKRIGNVGFINAKDREKYTNPTPSEFSELKREYRKREKESRREKVEKAESEARYLKQIAIKAPIKVGPFKGEDIIEGRIIVTGAYGEYSGAIGLIGKVDPDNKFPLDVFVCKQDFTAGKRKYEINAQELVSAIIDPENVSVLLTTYLIGLAIKHSTNFTGLIYLKTF